MEHWKPSLRAVALLGAALVTLPALAAEEGWVTLFNGRDLTGWVQCGGTATYRVEGGAIVGRTREGSPNSFLCTTGAYGDFELMFDVRLDDELNSGVQIRSQADGRVRGPQVEIATNEMAGQIYGEGLETGWLSVEEGDDRPEPRGLFRSGEWNAYRIRAVGQHIQTWVNREKVVDFMDDRSGMASGFVALQVHSIGENEGPYEVRWRNILIMELPGHQGQ